MFLETNALPSDMQFLSTAEKEQFNFETSLNVILNIAFKWQSFLILTIQFAHEYYTIITLNTAAALKQEYTLSV